MLSLGFFLLSLSAILAIIGLILQRQYLGKKQLPPGLPSWTSFVTMQKLGELTIKFGSQHAAVWELSKYYKSPVIGMKLASGYTVFVHGFEGVNTVFKNEDFDGRPWNKFIELRNLGVRKGITMNDGAEWKETRAWFQRNMRSVGFSRREMSIYIIEELEIVLKDIGNGGARPMKPIILAAIMNVLWIFTTGKRFDDVKLRYFIDLLERRAQAFDMTGGLLSAYPWVRYIAPEYSGFNVLNTINNEFRAALTETIEENKRNYIPNNSAHLVDRFLDEMYSGKGPEAGFDDDQLLLILLDIVFAGLSVTITSMEFLFLNMVINLDSQKKVHEEIDRVIGKERLPDIADKSKMAYTEAVIMESQRLVPVFPLLGPRRVMRDTKLLGYDIPKDSYLLMSIHSVFADPKRYPEPQKFKPERFIENGKCIHDENLFVFGKGHRQCPGVPLAKSAMFLIFTGIMQKYELLPVPGEDPPKLNIQTGMTLSPKPYNVLFKRR